MGGPGMGRGGVSKDDPSTVTSFKDTKIDGEPTAGEILGLFKVKGIQVRGDSRVRAVSTYRQYRQSAERALAKETIPIGMKGRVKAYFDSIDPNQPSEEMLLEGSGILTPPGDGDDGSVSGPSN